VAFFTDALRAALTARGTAGVYGELLTLSVVASISLEQDPGPWLIAITVAITNLVFWTAHVHASLISEWTHDGGRPGWAQAGQRMKREFPLFMACVPTIAVLALSGVGLYSVETAVWLSLVLGIALLGAWGIGIARIARLGVTGALTVAGINIVLGLAIVLLKVSVSH